MYDLPIASFGPQRAFSEVGAVAPRESSAGTSARILARMLDVVDYGLMLVHDGDRVAFANQIARNELDDRHPLQMVGNLLRARHPGDMAALRAALASAWHKGLQRLLTLDDDGDEPVTVAVVPMSDSPSAPPAAMLVFGKRNVCEDLSADAFARHYRLTDAEARVLKALCSGRRPSEIAAAQGVALCTVRTQIGCLREKVGAPSIGALLQKVARLPPLPMLLRAA